MYSLNLPVSQLRTKVRQEFERHRYVNKLPVVDMLLFQSHSEFQVYRIASRYQENPRREVFEQDFAGQMLMHHMIGNTKLLEADTTRYEVFSRNGKSDSKITCGFHARLSRGRHYGYSNYIQTG